MTAVNVHLLWKKVNFDRVSYVDGLRIKLVTKGETDYWL